MVTQPYPADAVSQFMFFDKLPNVDRSLVSQEKNNARYQEFVVPIVILVESQLWILIDCHGTNPKSLCCFVAVSQV
jgi:hypothetical protein